MFGKVINMKIRLGFVSNSSSSSFCIWGIYIDRDDHENFEQFEDTIEQLGLEIHSTPWDSYAVGRSFSSIKDDETGAQFKQGLADKLTLAGVNNKCGLCQEAWYDG